MLPKSAVEKLAKAKAKCDEMEHKLKAALCEVDLEEEERRCKKHEEQWECDAEVARAKKRAKPEAEQKKATADKLEKEAVAACIAKYEAKARLEVPKGQSIGGSDSEVGSDIETLGVRDMVSSE